MRRFYVLFKEMFTSLNKSWLLYRWVINNVLSEKKIEKAQAGL